MKRVIHVLLTGLAVWSLLLCKPIDSTATDLVESIPGMLLPVDITGTITDEDEMPLIGVNIQVKGSNQGTASDLDGRFSLTGVDENAILVVSYIGYQTQEIAVSGQTNFTITLRSDAQLLDELVVVGYGTQKKENLTGAVASVNVTEQAESRPITSLSSGL